MPSECNVCGAAAGEVFLEIPNQPVLSNVLWEDKKSARQTSKGDIQLTFCERCGHVFNRAYDEKAINYSGTYENSLFHSPVFRDYAANLAESIVNSFELRKQSIVEIGCGTGEWLKLLCRIGENRGWGFDPAYPKDAPRSDGGASFFRSEFDSSQIKEAVNFLVARHVLEHVALPSTFLKDLLADTNPKTGGYLEVPNGEWLLGHKRYWDVIYEHVSIFTTHSLRHLLSQCGLEILKLEEAFERQFLSACVRIGSVGRAQAAQPDDELARQAREFGASYSKKLGEEQEQLAEWRAHGKRIALWGAGSKGVSYLNMVQGSEAIEQVVDINPRKQGKFVGGSGHQISAPARLIDYQPDIVLLSNAIYQSEVREMLNQMGVNAVIVEF